MASINLGQDVGSLDVSPQLEAFNQVKINLSTDSSVHSTSTTGRLLEFTCPWATQAIANDVRAKIQGYTYQPMTANQAILDPAAELGDGITINGTSSGLFGQEETFERRHLSTISAPADEEVDHEYPYQSKVAREAKRADTRANEIKALEADTRARLGAAGIPTEGDPEEVVKILTTKDETDALGQVVATNTAAITVEGNRITSEVMRASNAEQTLATRITQTATSIRLDVEGLQSSYLELTENVATISASLTNITGALSVGDRVSINRGLYVGGGAVFADNVVIGNGKSLLTPGVSTSTLSLGGDAVSKTTLNVVTEFTQASGESATPVSKNLLTTSVGSATARTVAAGDTLTINSLAA